MYIIDNEVVGNSSSDGVDKHLKEKESKMASHWTHFCDFLLLFVAGHL